MESLIEEIISDLTIELQGDAGFSADILRQKVKNAAREVRLHRNYGATSMDETAIASDMQRFYSVIRDVALYDYNQVGIEFQLIHTENGVTRNYEYRNRMLAGVIPFAKVVV